MHDQADTQENIKKISSYVSKLLKQRFGKGPESSYVSANERLLFFHIKKFVSPMEEVLMESGKLDLAKRARNIIVNQSILPDLRRHIRHVMGKEPSALYHDWHYEHNSGMITVLFSSNAKEAEGYTGMSEENKLLRDAIITYLEKIVRKPEQIYSYQVNERLHIFELKGVTYLLEKALFEKGYSDIVTYTKNDLLWRSLNQWNGFRQVVKRSIDDIFFSWDYEQDKCMICIIVK